LDAGELLAFADEAVVEAGEEFGVFVLLAGDGDAEGDDVGGFESGQGGEEVADAAQDEDGADAPRPPSAPSPHCDEAAVGRRLPIVPSRNERG
jgi:hypothetical protein